MAANLGPLDDEIAGQHRARQGHRHAIPDLVVLGAAHDRLHAAGRADVDLTDRKFVRVGMLVARQHLPDHHLLKTRGAGTDDPFHLKSEKGDRAANFLNRRVEGHIILQPV